jgi:hypothetical protein
MIFFMVQFFMAPACVQKPSRWNKTRQWLSLLTKQHFRHFSVFEADTIIWVYAFYVYSILLRNLIWLYCVTCVCWKILIWQYKKFQRLFRNWKNISKEGHIHLLSVLLYLVLCLLNLSFKCVLTFLVHVI